mmetsp:Transcript_48705/g.162548  ORF Transcript_48705/g.162548 Transcript_48705/m.162548 type:complete len:367 (+) Transcript_48705:876-1976(+)
MSRCASMPSTLANGEPLCKSKSAGSNALARSMLLSSRKGHGHTARTGTEVSPRGRVKPCGTHGRTVMKVGEQLTGTAATWRTCGARASTTASRRRRRRARGAATRRCSSAAGRRAARRFSSLSAASSCSAIPRAPSSPTIRSTASTRSRAALSSVAFAPSSPRSSRWRASTTSRSTATTPRRSTRASGCSAGTARWRRATARARFTRRARVASRVTRLGRCCGPSGTTRHSSRCRRAVRTRFASRISILTIPIAWTSRRRRPVLRRRRARTPPTSCAASCPTGRSRRSTRRRATSPSCRRRFAARPTTPTGACSSSRCSGVSWATLLRPRAASSSGCVVRWRRWRGGRACAASTTRDGATSPSRSR